MGVKNLWEKASNHNIWSKVIAGLITALLTALFSTFFVFIYSLYRSINFESQIISFFSLQLKVWVYLLTTISFFIIWAIIKKFISKKTRTDQLSIPDNSEITISKNQRTINSMKQSGLIFDSNETDGSMYLPYQEKNWDSTAKKLIGNRGEGKFEIRDKILTINRSNSDGRYVVKLKEYYPVGKKSSFIPNNIYGNNPRNLRFSYSARAISGGVHKINIVFKRKDTHHWLNNVDAEITNKEWENQSGSLIINANENVFIEIHTTIISGSPGIVQIKHLKIEEI